MVNPLDPPGPEATRAERIRHAVAAVRVSLVVAVAVGIPSALQLDEAVPVTDAPSAEEGP